MTTNLKAAHLSLTDGKAYKNGLGHVEVVRLVDPDDAFPFEGESSLFRYMADGRYVSGVNELACYDLVEEVPVSMAGHPRIADGAELYPITRTLDYRVEQQFLVAAASFEEAGEKLLEFVTSDWSSAASSRLGVVQVADQMAQIEDSQGLVWGDSAIQAREAKVDSSMESLCKQNEADAMFDLLKKIAERPQMYYSNVSDLGYQAKAIVDKVQLEIREQKNVLVDVMVQAKPHE